jgi:hypothetical protein
MGSLSNAAASSLDLCAGLEGFIVDPAFYIWLGSALRKN